MKIAFFEVEEWMEAYVRERLAGHELRFSSEPLDTSNAAEFEGVEAVSVFVYSKVDREVLEKMGGLQLVSARSTGYDHIDVAFAKEKGVLVSNVPTYGSVTVAEHTWALILALSRNIYKSYQRTEAADFGLTGLRGFDLEGKTLGIVGLGEIGKKVAEMSRGFRMKQRVFTRTHDLEYASKFDNLVYVDKLEDLLSHSDVVSFHTPLVPETYHMLNLNNYRSLKPGCVVVNTSRGALIETKALVKALKEKIVRGAGLDVLESEGVIKGEAGDELENLPNENELAETYLNHLLIGMDNVIITPHNAFNSDESVLRLLDADLENIKCLIEGNRGGMKVVELG